MACIYLKDDSPCLAREHVIPAALGGQTKLPLGYVSDKANTLFSKTEMTVFRSSLLAINRRNLGPGKRGSLALKDTKNPQMLVLCDSENQNCNFMIGFIFCGMSYVIPQIIIDIEDETDTWRPFFTATNCGRKEFLNSLDFKQELISFLENPNRRFTLLNMPFKTSKHFIAIGLYNNNWFAATSHKIVNMDYLSFYFLDDIKDIAWNQSIQNLVPPQMHHYLTKFKVNIENEIFILAKIAFNTCALFTGNVKILMPNFDSIRNAIVGKVFATTKYEFCNNQDVACFSIGNLPNNCHFCLVQSNDCGVFAYVSLYSQSKIFRVVLSEVPIDSHFVKVLICDWQNNSEFTKEIS